MSTIWILTLPNGFFGRAEKGWKSLDLLGIKSMLEEFGHEVKFGDICKALKYEIQENEFVFYTSSDEPSIRAYIKDVIYLLAKRCTVVPEYESLLAHENKGFQQLWRYENKIGGLSGDYFFDKDDLPQEYPYVYKSVTGAGSKDVYLVKNDADRKKVSSKEFRVSSKRKIIKILQRFKISSSEYSEYLYRHKGFGLGVWQEFISNLKCDYKVLVYGQKYYVLTRQVRKGDFRASGSGNFDYASVASEVLEYARRIFQSLNVPFASLDIAEQKGNCFLIEYQCTHFGPYTILNSDGYYERDSFASWHYVNEKPNLEHAIANSLNDFIALKKN
ncbi:hypothetical protein [Halopseudomonas pelagia]|uniref:hypothetical protein n=1 Tax=Halopseudomonas pelagia TaxID=553151 RepID=UPI0003A3BDF9|nr:hypothetical protein [Halopseudomonas pelagia]